MKKASLMGKSNKIELIEFDPKLYENPPKNYLSRELCKESARQEFNISLPRLACYTARAMLTRVGTNYTKNVSAYARAFLQVAPFQIEGNSANFWSLSNDIKMLRDFSKTSRIGELAQGISYYACKEYLRAYSIYDYREYIDEKCGTIKDKIGKAPDYVVLYRDGNVGIVEVKGSAKTNPTKALNSAKTQLENGKIVFSKYGLYSKSVFASVVMFGPITDIRQRNIKLYLLDPYNATSNNLIVNYRDELMREVSKHICFSGNLELANYFKNKQVDKIKEWLSKNEKDRVEMIPVGTIEASGIEDKGNRFELGITRELMAYLEKDENMPFIFDGRANENTEFFDDGTYITLLE